MLILDTYAGVEMLQNPDVIIALRGVLIRALLAHADARAVAEAGEDEHITRGVVFNPEAGRA